jgi:hypothetical protein
MPQSAAETAFVCSTTRLFQQSDVQREDCHRLKFKKKKSPGDAGLSQSHGMSFTKKIHAHINSRGIATRFVVTLVSKAVNSTAFLKTCAAVRRLLL